MNAVDIEALQQTNFEFDIEANRRRRAELANDVSELINISKFFLQHYSSDSPEEIAPTLVQKAKKVPIITKHEKNEANTSKARGRCSSRNVQAKKNAVVKATVTHVKRKQMRINNGTVNKVCANGDDVPPLFDKIKLHEYCVDIVDRFFHGPPTNDSETSESSKEQRAVKKSQSIEKSVQTTNGGNNIENTKTKRVSKYALVPSRYMNNTPQKMTNELPMKQNNEPSRLVSAKSREILEEVARKGTIIKRHSCLLHKRDPSVEYREHGSPQKEVNRSQIRFRDMHPSIELVPSNAIFPKRILKQPSESKESSPTEKRSNQEEIGTKQLEIGLGDMKSIASVNGVIGQKSPSESETKTESIPSSVPEYRQKKELQFQQLPVLSIKPEAKCEIANIYEIEIKPHDAKADDFLIKDKNKVIELVYKSPGQDIQHDESKSIVSNGSKRKQYVKSTNKYTAPFVNGELSVEMTTDDKMTADDTEDATNVESNLSLNLSTSHMTDDEKFRSDKKTNGVKASVDLKIDLKADAKCLIDKILEVEGFSESNPAINSTKNENIAINASTRNRTENFDDLREILRKIRNDKTTLDEAIDAIEPPELVSPARTLIDRETQCDNLQKPAVQKSETNSPPEEIITPVKRRSRKLSSSECSAPYINSSFMESPKFNKTIESIRSSARKLDFNLNSTEYQAVTRQQIERAAKKFLKSILKNADANIPKSGSDDSTICMKMNKQKYRIVDDQIIQSNFNIKSKHGNSTSSSSNDVASFQLRLPSADFLNDQNRKKCNKWIDQTMSDFTANSIEKHINNHKNNKLPHTNQLHKRTEIYDDLSDGEILSEGEFHIP